MTGCVLDASIAVGWAFADEDSEYGARVQETLITGFAVVPGMWPYEVANALATAVRRARISVDAVAAYTTDLACLDITVAANDTDPLSLAAAALEWGVSAYDASYLLLASRMDLPLATADQQLGRAATLAGVALLE